MKEVVRMAMMVPMGMDLWASRRSPDLLEPAIIPERENQRTPSSAQSSAQTQADRSSSLGRLLKLGSGQYL